MSTLLERLNTEGYYDYLDRLFSNKAVYGIDCNKIADLMNVAFNNDFSESKYRKQWTYFNDGRIYERGIKASSVHTRILTISDLHVPYQLPISTFSEYAGKIDILVLNGDLLDCQSLSRFIKSYRESPMDEIVHCRQYLIDLIEMLNPHEVYATVGNHDARLQSYLSKNLDSDILELMPATALDLIFEDGIRRYDKRSKAKVWYDPLNKVFPDIKIHFDGDWKLKLGSVWFAHPFAFSSGNLKTAERAMEYFLKNDGNDISAVIMAHTHRCGQIKKGRIYVYEQGACCQVNKMNYVDGRLSDSQQMGYMFVALDRQGDIIYDETKLVIL